MNKRKKEKKKESYKLVNKVEKIQVTSKKLKERKKENMNWWNKERMNEWMNEWEKNE